MDFLSGLFGYVVPFVFVLSLVVFIHEMGHFLVARWFGIIVEQFSIGFGREVAGWTDKNGTRWKVGWLPLGGYVKFLGDESAASTPDRAALEKLPEDVRGDCFQFKPLHARAAVVAAGPVANFILAIIIFAFMYSVVGQTITAPRIDKVLADGPAAAAGFEPGDLIVSIQGSEIVSFNDMQGIVSTSPERELDVVVERDGALVDLVVVPELKEITDRFGNTQMVGMIGLSRSNAADDLVTVRYNPAVAVWKGVEETGFIISTTFSYLGDIIVGRQNADQLGGPLRIAQVSGQVATLGLLALLNLAAILSVSIGLLNLFPIPMLDGGHLLYYAVEAVRGEPLGEKAQEYGFRIGLAAVLSLMLFATWNDLVHLRVVEYIGSVFSCAMGRNIVSFIHLSHLQDRAVAALAAFMLLATPAIAQTGPAAPPSAQAAPDASAQDAGGQSSLEIARIQVEGNQRVEAETVRSYMTIREGQEVTAKDIDTSLKTLFGTGLFADVSIRQSGRDLIVTVVENPIINRVAFEGNYRIDDDDLSAETELKPRVVFTRARVQSDLQRIIELYRRKGNFAAAIEPKIIQLPQNRVDLVYEISEGPETGVSSIKFVGNKAFSDSELRGEIATAESAWWKFLSTNDNYDPDRLTFDRELLRRFYLINGYADFRVLSSVAEMAPDGSEFFITFTVEEGELYTFGEIDVQTELARLDTDELRKLVPIEAGDQYDASKIDDAVDALTFAAGTEGYAFSDVRPRVRRDREERKINITFRIDEGPRVYVERINVNGNVRTLDRVIRRELRLAEGDAFNRVLLSRSRDRIRSLGLFARVEVTEEPGSQEDLTVINVDVEETSTGELSIGAGFSSDTGIIGDLAIIERNLLGRGQFLRLRLSLSGDRQQIDLRFTEPYFMGRNLSAGIDLFGTESDFQDESGFDFQQTGIGFRFGFPMSEFSSLQLRTSYVREEIKNVASNASISVQASEGKADAHLLGYTYSLDQRNDPEKPTGGYTFFFEQDLGTPLGDTTFLESELGGAIYYGINEDFIASLRVDAGYIFGYNGDDVRLNNRFFKGGSSFRGFEPSGVGPRDTITDDALGANAFAIGSAQLTVPLFLPEELGITGAVFSDFGVVGLNDEDDRFFLINGAIVRSDIQDDLAFRASGGFSLFWESPFGPVRVDLAEAFLKQDYDKEQFFRFSAGTSF